MNIEELRDYCLSLNEVTECFPFDEVTLVFKVAGKMFLLTNLDGPLSINIKCNPKTAIHHREQYLAVTPGYHMNKKHWNTVMLDNSIPDSIIKEWIHQSYLLVIKTLPKNKQKDLI